jgi:UPF0042 nucleotide-binding protein
MKAITVVAYGIGHGPLEDFDLAVNLTRQLKDPHFNPDPSFRELTGYDQVIIDSVMDAQGGKAAQIVGQLLGEIVVLAEDLDHLIVGVACKGGRHRSVVVANLLAKCLLRRGYKVDRVDRDIEKGVLAR